MGERSISGMLAAALAVTTVLTGAFIAWGMLTLKRQGALGAYPEPRLAVVAPVPVPAQPQDRPERRPRRTLAREGAQPSRNAPDRTALRRWADPRGETPAETHPRLAIVIDDIGYTVGAPREFLALDVPITFSILPGLLHSRDAAGLIGAAGREYIIHMPMQPMDFPQQDPGPEALLLDQDARETRRRLESYLAELPGARGASNHMGSAYTMDARRMELVQQELAQRHLFFLNSKTSASPVSAGIARRAGYPYLERDVFLDNERDERLIGRELERAVTRARQNGQAIAIGHPYPETFRVLRGRLTQPELEGVSLVSLSDLLGR